MIIETVHTGKVEITEGFAIGFRQYSVDQLVELGVLRLKEQ